MAVVQKEEEIIIRPNDSASVLDAEMTAIRVALGNARETRDKITIHTNFLTAVNILNNRKLETGLKYNYEGHQIRSVQINTEADYSLDTRPYWNTG